MDFYEQTEVLQSIEDIEKILATGIFTPEQWRNPFFKAAFIEMMINLRSLMFHAEKFSTKIDFTDDVRIEGKVVDVSELIRFVRDALCHLDLKHHHVNSGGYVSFNISFGKFCTVSGEGYRHESSYDDDIAFSFGDQRIYLTRHIVRAFEEAKSKLIPLLDDWLKPKGSVMEGRFL
ncbi:hypothetical protein [Pseudomonas syringae]|uniref:hypothetical protein n=1 Tax=Pseudomonas syringae TaxID=317 RepID=UPI001BD19577|nr:hypothetical protein [Pseudomonas syringae]QVI69166.1 hypothetical protein KHW12_18740 [Pseudomonas syringae]